MIEKSLTEINNIFPIIPAVLDSISRMCGIKKQIIYSGSGSSVICTARRLLSGALLLFFVKL